MINNTSRNQLINIIEQYSHTIIHEHKRLWKLLNEFSPERQRENNLLMFALKQNVPHDLLKSTELIQTDISVELTRLALRLYDNYGTQLDFSYWAVESWALALNIITQPVQQAINLAYSQNKTNLALTKQSKQQIGEFIVQEGVALDIHTQLMWCRFAYGQVWRNNEAIGKIRTVEWKPAFNVVEEFNKQGGYLGYTDWRLPTVEELLTLIVTDKSKRKRGYYLDAEVFPKGDVKSFWSSELCTKYDGRYAWIVDFGNGKNDDHPISWDIAIRFVRNEK